MGFWRNTWATLDAKLYGVLPGGVNPGSYDAWNLNGPQELSLFNPTPPTQTLSGAPSGVTPTANPFPIVAATAPAVPDYFQPVKLGNLFPNLPNLSGVGLAAVALGAVLLLGRK